MVLTNALLSVAFSVVASFTNVVPVPPEAVPARIEDLRRFQIGDPHSPLDVSLVSKTGAIFNIRDGAVFMYQAPLSYSQLQDADLLPRLMGKPTLNPDQALALATRTITALAKGTNPIAGVKPVLRRAGEFEGQPIPFYEISWPKPDPGVGFAFYAGIEIDARSGQITRLALHDPAFHDLTLAQQIKAKVYVPDRLPPALTNPAKSAPPHRLFPMPTTNQVTEAIASWLWLCQRLTINAGPDTNLATVSWDRTFLWTNGCLPGAPLECAVEFQNGAYFCAVSGVALGHSASDACSVGDQRRFTPEQIAAFSGPIKKDWKALGEDLRRALTERLLVPESVLSPYKLEAPTHGAPPVGSRGFKRVCLDWTNPRRMEINLGRTMPTLGFGAEVDLETGQIPHIGFCDPKIIEAIARAQGKDLHFPDLPWLGQTSPPPSVYHLAPSKEYFLFSIEHLTPTSAGSAPPTSRLAGG